MFRRLASFFVSGWSKQPAVSTLEGFFLRLLFGLVAIYTIHHLRIDQTSEPHPVGLLKLLKPLGFSLTWLADPELYSNFYLIFVILAAVYVIGFGLPVVLPVLAVMHILPFTLYNSQGYAHHGYQIVSLTLLIQAVTAVYAASCDRRSFLLPGADLRRWLWVQSQVVITATYLVSFVTKMETSEGKWLWNSHHVAVDMVKTQRQNYLNRFDPKYAEATAEALWFLEHPRTSRILFSSGVILEAVCIFAIGNRTLGLLFGLSLILMHRSIAHLMGLTFVYNELLVMIFLVGVPWGLAWCFERIRSHSIRRGTLLGMGTGLLLSVLLQPTFGIQPIQTLGPHFQRTVNIVGLWSKGNPDEITHFLIPLIKILLLSGALGALIGWLCPICAKRLPT